MLTTSRQPPYLREQVGGRIGIGSNITHVQKVFKGIFNLEPGFRMDGSQFDHLFQEGEAIPLGELSGEVMFVPGHTPACAAYRFGGRCVRGRHLVHAGCRHGTLRFSGWRCPGAVRLHPQAAQPAPRDASVHVP